MGEEVESIMTFSGRALSMPKSFSDTLFLQVQFLLHLWFLTTLSRNHRDKITCASTHTAAGSAVPFPTTKDGEPTLQTGTHHIMKTEEQVNRCSGRQSGKFLVCGSAEEDSLYPGGISRLQVEHRLGSFQPL